jgi:hypothetical protein
MASSPTSRPSSGPSDRAGAACRPVQASPARNGRLPWRPSHTRSPNEDTRAGEVSQGPPAAPGGPGRRRPAPGRHHGPRRPHRHRSRLSPPDAPSPPEARTVLRAVRGLPGLDPTPRPAQDCQPGSGQGLALWSVCKDRSAVTESMVLLDPSVRTPLISNPVTFERGVGLMVHAEGWVLTPLCSRPSRHTHGPGTIKRLLRRVVPTPNRSACNTSSPGYWRASGAKGCVLTALPY